MFVEQPLAKPVGLLYISHVAMNGISAAKTTPRVLLVTNRCLNSTTIKQCIILQSRRKAKKGAEYERELLFSSNSQGDGVFSLLFS